MPSDSQAPSSVKPARLFGLTGREILVAALIGVGAAALARFTGWISSLTEVILGPITRPMADHLGPVASATILWAAIVLVWVIIFMWLRYLDRRSDPNM